MSNWKLLDNSAYTSVWNFVYDKLHFKPYNKEHLISFLCHYICFDLTSFYDNGFNEALYDNLHEEILVWFKKASNGEELYALNWQHDCYAFNPDLPFEKDEFNEWLIPVFPNGDYLFFLTKDFKNGIFADGINFTFSFWGMNSLTCQM